MQYYKLHRFSLRHTALDDRIHGNLHEVNAQVYLWELSSNMSLQPPDPATVSEANTQWQIMMCSSKTKLIVKIFSVEA